MQLFRQVIPVYVTESAGSDLIAIAVEDAFVMPEAVIFPHRYQEGARIYKENNPEIPVIVIGGSRPTEEEIFFRIQTDRTGDLYRAGLSAAFLAGDLGVLIFTDGSMIDEYRDAFREGLMERGFLDDPVFINANAVFTAYDDKGSIVVAGPEQQHFEYELDLPIVLFSWVDPRMTPPAVKIIFDDSAWTLAAEAFRALNSGETEVNLGSVTHIIRERLNRNDFRLLGNIVKANLQNN